MHGRLVDTQTSHVSTPGSTINDGRTYDLEDLARLSEAEENAGRVSATAAQRLENGPLATQAREDAATHETRRQALAELIQELGGSAPRHDECRQLLTRGADALARARSDAEVMEALATLRQELSAAYDEAIADPHLDASRRAALGQLSCSCG